MLRGLQPTLSYVNFWMAEYKKWTINFVYYDNLFICLTQLIISSTLNIFEIFFILRYSLKEKVVSAGLKKKGLQEMGKLKQENMFIVPMKPIFPMKSMSSMGQDYLLEFTISHSVSHCHQIYPLLLKVILDMWDMRSGVNIFVLMFVTLLNFGNE